MAAGYCAIDFKAGVVDRVWHELARGEAGVEWRLWCRTPVLPEVTLGEALMCADQRGEWRYRVDQIVAVADARARLVVSPGVLDRLERVRTTAIGLAQQRPIYGRSTGVGANKSVDVGDRHGHAQGQPVPRQVRR